MSALAAIQEDVYTFDQLSDEAKRRARDARREDEGRDFQPDYERAYSDTVTVTVDSGDPGGVQDEFAEEMQKFLLQWFDGAAVGLRPANLKPKRFPLVLNGKIVYVSIPED